MKKRQMKKNNFIVNDKNNEFRYGDTVVHIPAGYYTAENLEKEIDNAIKNHEMKIILTTGVKKAPPNY